jgi:hypothetical protein
MSKITDTQPIYLNRTITVEYSRLWGRYTLNQGTMSILDTDDRALAYSIYRRRTGQDITLKEFLTLVKYT